MALNLWSFHATLLVYAVATVLYLAVYLANWHKATRASEGILALGFGLHCVTLGLRFWELGYTPVTNLHESLSFFAWAIIGCTLLFGRRYGLHILGALLVPLALALMLAGSFSDTSLAALNPVLDSFWLPIHVIFSFLGHAVFTVAFAAAVLYLMQERMLKHKKFHRLFRGLPSLGVLDNINYRCLSWGFPLLTMGIISGAVWAEAAWGSYWSWDPKETWSLITWFVYAALLHGRLTVGWRGRRAAVWAIIGFMCLLFTFLGVNLLLPGLHSYATIGG